MIDTEKTAKGKQFFFDKQKDVPTKKKLEARWQTVNGKLVCQWVEVETKVKPALVIDNVINREINNLSENEIC